MPVIRMYTPDMEADLQQACTFDRPVGSKILSLKNAYGTGNQNYNVYIAYGRDGSPQGAVGNYQGGGSISAGSQLDYDELAEFIAATGQFRFMFGSLGMAQELGRRVGGELFTSPTMVYRGVATGVDICDIDFSPRLRDVYRIISDANPFFAEHNPYNPWLSYTKQLERSGQAICCVLNKGHIPVATGGIYSMGAGVGVIASIATLPGSQGKGYGKIITQCLIDRLLQIGLTPALFCRVDSLTSYYGPMGFQECGNWGQRHFSHN